MLALTPQPLHTEGERALFAELARWDTGGAVRGAVVASLPTVTDGPLQRRLSDAVLFVPDGLAVVRVVEVERQRGIVAATPEGAWTISPDGGPGEVLQLAGGGSTPLDGLMRAGMDAAVRLRRAGLEPGRIARLTVLVGDLTGLDPADGDLGEGDQVAIAEPRSLLLGIARAGRYAAVDNPRLWTTADVRAALEALGLPGRGPTVEELNGEGFAYSPYVLRRPELLAPAAMTAAATAPPDPAGPSPDPVAVPAARVVAPPASAPAVGAPAPRAAVPAPVGAVPAPVAAPVAAAPGPELALTTSATQPAFAAAAAAAAAPPLGAAPAGAPFGGAPSAASFGGAPSTASFGGTPTAVASAPGAAHLVDPFAGRPMRDTIDLSSPPPVQPADDTDGIGGLFATADPDEPAGSPSHTAVLSSSWTPPAYSVPPADSPVAAVGGRRRGRRTLVLVAAALVLLAVVAVGGVLLLTGGLHRSAATGPSGPAPRAAAAPVLAIGSTQAVGGRSFRLEALKVDTTCVGHSYGQVAGFFTATDCTGLSRALYSTQVDGHAMVLAVSRTRMPDAATAARLKKMADDTGTGNVSDLLREGTTYSGGPTRLGATSEYASKLSGPVVTIVETAWAVPATAGTADQLDSAAEEGVDLPVSPFSG